MYYCIIFQKKPIPPPLMVNGISKGEGRGGIKWLKFPAAWGHARLLPNRLPGARGSSDLLAGQLKFLNKEPAQAPKTYDSYGKPLSLLPVKEQQNFMLILHFWNKNVKMCVCRL